MTCEAFFPPCFRKEEDVSTVGQKDGLTVGQKGSGEFEFQMTSRQMSWCSGMCA